MPAATRLDPRHTRPLMALRAEALATDPWAFGSAPGDDRFEDEAWTRDALNREHEAIFGVELDDRLVAMAGVLRSDRLKHAHLASIVGVYTAPDHRGQGLARAVVRACIEHARAWPGVDRVGLSVSERTPAARRLYESLGFEPWGVEPAATRIGHESAAEVHMSMPL